MYVPKNDTAVVSIKAEIPTISVGADSGDLPTLDYNEDSNFSALGESSNVATTNDSGESVMASR